MQRPFCAVAAVVLYTQPLRHWGLIGLLIYVPRLIPKACSAFAVKLTAVTMPYDGFCFKQPYTPEGAHHQRFIVA